LRSDQRSGPADRRHPTVDFESRQSLRLQTFMIIDLETVSRIFVSWSRRRSGCGLWIPSSTLA
jgi:hypothetical protein